MVLTKGALRFIYHLIASLAIIKYTSHYMTNFLNCGLFFKFGQTMFKWTFLERENIAESKTGLYLSLHGLDVEIMAIKDW